MFNELWWLNYCFCQGRGVGAIGNPFFGSEVNEICIHSKCQMTDIGDPFCARCECACALPTSAASLQPTGLPPACASTKSLLVRMAGAA